MTLTLVRTLPALLLAFTLLAPPVPAYSHAEAAANKHRRPPATTAARIDAYSPRVRRSTITYLRLRLLELHEAGLDRARAAIERRLSIDDMLAEPTVAPRTDPLRGAEPRPQRSP